eukprot:Awhi_evm1s8846
MTLFLQNNFLLDSLVHLSEDEKHQEGVKRNCLRKFAFKKYFDNSQPHIFNPLFNSYLQNLESDGFVSLEKSLLKLNKDKVKSIKSVSSKAISKRTHNAQKKTREEQLEKRLQNLLHKVKILEGEKKTFLLKQKQQQQEKKEKEQREKLILITPPSTPSQRPLSRNDEADLNDMELNHRVFNLRSQSYLKHPYVAYNQQPQQLQQHQPQPQNQPVLQKQATEILPNLDSSVEEDLESTQMDVESRGDDKNDEDMDKDSDINAEALEKLNNLNSEYNDYKIENDHIIQNLQNEKQSLEEKLSILEAKLSENNNVQNEFLEYKEEKEKAIENITQQLELLTQNYDEEKQKKEDANKMFQDIRDFHSHYFEQYNEQFNFEN